ncbi:MAG: major facilitator superfamily 1 [Rhodospirillales bacterium]|nr:major facilitator superfamily 1 [Rhodospirillales bacterium]
MRVVPSTQAGPAGRTQPTARATPRAWYVLGVLTVVMAISYADRFALAILLIPIKEELHLSDTEIGLLTGLAFSLFYAMCSLPIARLADRGSRKAILIVALAAWSVMTGMTGAVTNVWHLFVARFGVGAGEAGSVPASYSIIGDLFPPDRRTTALAIFTAGGPLGMLIAFAVGGWLGQVVGWRMAFFVLAVPGIVVAILIATTIKEPARAVAADRSVEPVSLVLRRTIANRRLFHYLLGYSVSVLLLYGQLQWLPAFFHRSFGVEGAALGVSIAMTRGVGTIVGLVLGGWLADRFGKRDPRWPDRMIFGANLAGLLPSIGVVIAGQLDLAYALSVAAGFFTALAIGPLTAAIQAEAAPRERATIGGVMLVMSSVIGIGAGPLLVGGCSDLLAASAGADSLRYAMLIVIALGGPWMLAHFAVAARRRAIG